MSNKIEILATLNDQISKNASNIGKNIKDNITDTVKKATLAITAFGTATAFMGIKAVNTAQKLDTQLNTVFQGNIDLVKEAKKTIFEFAKSTPFQVEEVTSAFIKLNNMGLKSSNEELKSYGDTASAMGKSLDQMIEAVADASVGEFERLKEFGIKASVEGDRVKFTFNGVTTEIGKNSAEIENYLVNLGKTKFAGGMERQSKTLAGLFSTLRDSVDLLLVKVFEGTGIIDYLGEGINIVTEFLTKNEEAIISLAKKGMDFLRGAADKVISVFKFLDRVVIENRGGLTRLKDTIVSLTKDGIDVIASAVGWLSQMYYENEESITALTTSILDFANNAIVSTINALQSFFTLIWSYKDVVIETFELFAVAINLVLEYLRSPDFTNFINLIRDGFITVMNNLAEAWRMLRPHLEVTYNLLAELLPPIIALIGYIGAGLIVVLSKLAGPVFTSIVFGINVVLAALVLLRDTVVAVFNGIVNHISGSWESVKQILKFMAQGIQALFTGDVGSLGAALKGILNTLVDRVNSTLNFQFELLGNQINIDFPDIPRFADGGVVGGNSRTGDRLLARVNSGEVVLNERQQQNALSQMEGGKEVTIINNFSSDFTVETIMSRINYQLQV